MKFSVLMSIYIKEKPEYLALSLESVIKQSLPPDEIVIVEDGPLTKELYKVIDDFKGVFPKIKTVQLEKNYGLGYALNVGLQHCSHEIVARMDADDICRNDRFERQLNFLAKHPDIDVVGSWVLEFYNTHEAPVSLKRVPESHEEIIRYARKRCPFNHMTVMFKKSAVNNVGGYKPFLYFEDYYLWVRMILNNAKLANIPEPLVYVRADKNMFKRRGGLRYLKQEIVLEKTFLNLGFINRREFVFNVIARTVFRVSPNVVRQLLYRLFLRDNPYSEEFQLKNEAFK